MRKAMTVLKRPSRGEHALAEHSYLDGSPDKKARRIIQDHLLTSAADFLLSAGMPQPVLIEALRSLATRLEASAPCAVLSAENERLMSVVIRISEVTHDWMRKIDTTDAHGDPKPLCLRGRNSLGKLIRRHVPGVPVGEVVQWMCKHGLTKRLSNGKYKLLKREVLMLKTDTARLAWVTSLIIRHLATARYNLKETDQRLRHLNRASIVLNLPTHELSRFRQFAKERTGSLLEEVDNWLQDRGTSGRNGARVEAGMHVCTFAIPDRPNEIRISVNRGNHKNGRVAGGRRLTNEKINELLPLVQDGLLSASAAFLLQAGVDRTELSQGLWSIAAEVEQGNNLRARACRDDELLTLVIQVGEVAHDWLRKIEHTGKDGEPMALRSGGKGGLAALIKEHVPRAKISEIVAWMCANRLIKRLPNGCYMLLKREILMLGLDPFRFACTAAFVTRHLATAASNLKENDERLRHVNRATVVLNLPKAEVSNFREFARQRAQSLLDEVDNWLQDRDVTMTHGKGIEAGLHVCTYAVPAERNGA